MKSQCPTPGCDGKGDNLIEYPDGYYCHACGYLEKDKENNKVSLLPKKLLKDTPMIEGGQCTSLDNRGISLNTAKFFDYRTTELHGYPAHIANYYDNFGKIVAQKIRKPDKEFFITGDGKNKENMPLYGQWKWQPNPNMFVTIVEGELDALSVAEVQGLQFPVVSVPKGSDSAVGAIKRSLQWLNGFKHVVLWLDNDEPGQLATKQCLELFDPGKLRVVTHTAHKDANEVLTKELNSSKLIQSILLNAQIVNNCNVIEPSDITLEDLEDLATVGWDALYPRLNHMINGLRSNHLYTLVARPKVGKTTLTKELAMHLATQGVKVGLLYLEENATKEAISLWAMQEKIPMWKIENDLKSSKFRDKVKKGMESFKDKGIYIYNHKGAIDTVSVYKAMHYLVKGLGCQFIILDNISISIAGSGGDNERKLIDKMVFDLISLINQTKCTIFNIVHTIKNKKDADGNDDESITRADIFGSGAFAKFSHVVLGLQKINENTVSLKVLANRDRGIEGFADTLRYNTSTGRLELANQTDLPEGTTNE